MGSKRVYKNNYSALGMTADDFRSMVQYLAKSVTEMASQLEADAVVVRGTSGYSVAFAMRMFTDVDIVVARKPGEQSHGGTLSMFAPAHDKPTVISKYIILDDLVCSGSTVAGIITDMEPAKCVGVILYEKLLEIFAYTSDINEVLDHIKIKPNVNPSTRETYTYYVDRTNLYQK